MKRIIENIDNYTIYIHEDSCYNTWSDKYSDTWRDINYGNQIDKLWRIQLIYIKLS